MPAKRRASATTATCLLRQLVMRPASAALTRPAQGRFFLLIVKVSIGG